MKVPFRSEGVEIFRLFNGMLAFIYLLLLITLYSTTYVYLYPNVELGTSYGVLMTCGLFKVIVVGLIVFCCIKKTLSLWWGFIFGGCVGLMTLITFAMLLLLVKDSAMVANKEFSHPSHPANDVLFCCVYYERNTKCFDMGPCLDETTNKTITSEDLKLNPNFKMSIFLFLIIFFVEVAVLNGFLMILKSINSDNIRNKKTKQGQDDGLFMDVPFAYSDYYYAPPPITKFFPRFFVPNPYSRMNLDGLSSNNDPILNKKQLIDRKIRRKTNPNSNNIEEGDNDDDDDDPPDNENKQRNKKSKKYVKNEIEDTVGTRQRRIGLARKSTIRDIDDCFEKKPRSPSPGREKIKTHNSLPFILKNLFLKTKSVFNNILAYTAIKISNISSNLTGIYDSFTASSHIDDENEDDDEEEEEEENDEEVDDDNDEENEIERITNSSYKSSESSEDYYYYSDSGNNFRKTFEIQKLNENNNKNNYQLSSLTNKTGKTFNYERRYNEFEDKFGF